MSDYLEQFRRFSQGISQSSLEATQGITESVKQVAAQKAQAQKYQFEEAVRMRKQMSKDLYGDSFSNMYDWMKADLIAERDWYANNLGSTDTPQYQAGIAHLKAGASMYETATQNYEGDPGDPSTSGTRYGMLNALSEMERGINPYEANDQATVDPYDVLVNGVQQRYQTLQRGKSAQEQYLGGYMNDQGDWMLRFGDPTNPDSIRDYKREDLVANLEGSNAYAPQNGFKDINIPTLREVAADSKVKAFVGDDPNGYSTYYRTMVSGEGKAHTRFKRAVFDEMAPEFFDEDELPQMRQLFLSGTMGIQYDRGEDNLIYDNVDARIEKMLASGLERFRQSSERVTTPESDEPEMDYNDIRFESFDKSGGLRAYENIPRGRFEGALTAALPGMFPAFEPDVVDNINTMTVIPSTELEAGSDVFVKAVALGRDGRMVAKVIKETPVQLTDGQVLAGIDPSSIAPVETVDYMIIPQNLEANFYKEVGSDISPDSSDFEEVGRQYLFDTYIKESQSEAELPQLTPGAVSTSSTQRPVSDTDLLPGEPADEEIDFRGVYAGEAGDMRLISELNRFFGDSVEAGMWYRKMMEDPSLLNVIMPEIHKGREPMYIDGELVFERRG